MEFRTFILMEFHMEIQVVQAKEQGMKCIEIIPIEFVGEATESCLNFLLINRRAFYRNRVQPYPYDSVLTWSPYKTTSSNELRRLINNIR